MSRKSTGLLRPYPVPVNLGGDEDEYIARKAFSRRISKTELLRKGALRQGWEKELLKLRQQQKAMPVKEFRRAPLERVGDVR